MDWEDWRLTLYWRMNDKTRHKHTVESTRPAPKMKGGRGAPCHGTMVNPPLGATCQRKRILLAYSIHAVSVGEA